MLEKVKEYIKENEMLACGDKVVVGVSGGADSTALFQLLDMIKEEYELTLYVVHINHGIRREAADDAEFVRGLCEQKGVPFYLFSEDIPMVARRDHLSEEEAGRRFRYHCFYKVMEETGAHKLAVAHHMDDQAETVLFHLVRGTDLAGAAGMRPVSLLPVSMMDGGLYEDVSGGLSAEACKSVQGGRNKIIRPLLNTRRAEITAWLNDCGIRWQEDVTNSDDNYSRNRIRNRVMNDLSIINDRASEHISEFARRVALYDEYIKRQALSFIHKEVEGFCDDMGAYSFETVVKIKRDHLLLQDKILADRVLYELLTRIAGAKKDITGEHIEELYELLSKQSGRKINLPYGVFAYVSYEWLVLGRDEENYNLTKRDNTGHVVNYPDKRIEIGIDDLKYDEDLSIKISEEEKIVFRLVEMKNFIEICEKFEKNYTKYFDCDTIGNTLYIRYPEPEDYFICDGEGHRKKLSKYFKDIKLPAEERGRRLILSDGHEVLWVIGKRRCEAHLVAADTQRILKVEYIHKD